MAKLNFRFAAVPHGLVHDPSLKPIDHVVAEKLIRLAKGCRIWASNETLAKLCGVCVGTLKYSVRRLERAGWLRRLRGAIRGVRRVLELAWLAPAEPPDLPPADHPAAPPGKVNGLTPEGSTDCPQEPPPPDPPYRKERDESERDGGGAGPCGPPVEPAIAVSGPEEPPPPFLDLSTPLEKTPDPEPVTHADPRPATPEEVATIERLAPRLIPGPDPAGRVKRIARNLGLGPGCALRALQRAEEVGPRNPIGFVAKLLRDYRAEGPPPTAEEVAAHQAAKHAADLAFINAHLFGKEAPA